jgi:hypothetical protein
MPVITKKEERLIAPHKYYGYKCGMSVKHTGLDYLFMGYVDKTQCMLADKHGNKFITFLNNINEISNSN